MQLVDWSILNGYDAILLESYLSFFFLTSRFRKEESLTLNYTYVIIWLVAIYSSVRTIKNRDAGRNKMDKLVTKVREISKLFR